MRNLAREGSRAIGDALLDQRSLAGIGSIYSAEICFRRRALPSRPVSETADLGAVVDLARSLLLANRDRAVRTTTGSSRGDRLWVYGRDHRPCLRCGTLVRRGEAGRRAVYWCPRCQT